MAKLAKFLQGVAGAGGAGALNIEEVFSNYLYDGTGAAQTITNGIDLDGEGGLVWIKRRSNSASHALVDTERGDDKYLKSDSTSSESTRATMLSFSSTGFSLDDGFSITNGSGGEFASWTFRKAPKFFDVVTYTGTGSATTISHNLGSVPGCIIVKRTDSTENWKVYHRAIHPTNNGSGYVINLNLTNARAATTIWSSTEPTSTEFSISGSSTVNASGGTYVAYLFAHNDGDGDFGPTGDQDIIKCGSFTADGSGGVSVDLGFEPQWIMYKPTSTTGPWVIVDSMRGWTANSESRTLTAESSGAEQSVVNLSSSYPLNRRSDGFDTSNALYASQTYIYIAIRRGPMAVPESATDVFEQAFATSPGNPNYVSGFPVDAALRVFRDGSSVYPQMSSRLTQGKYLKTSSTAAEVSFSSWTFDYQDGVIDGTSASSLLLTYMWKRAPNYFDVVAYHGNSTSGRTVSHNLGVAPEMIWVKNRDSPVDWWCYHKDLGNTKYVKLNTTDAAVTDSTAWNNTTPTDTVITLGNSGRVNYSNDDYIAYLFASLDGVSKVGSYTGNGSSNGDSQNIDCGFSSGARFVLIKRTDISSNWLVFDSTRGIVAGNDPVLVLNSTNAEYTTTDEIDPYSSGFAVTVDVTGFATNVSGASYIFYAIA